MTEPEDTSPALNKAGILKLQQITGKFLYYARAVDPTMITALSALASQQAKGTEQTMCDALKFLNYCATHPDATLRYYASDMILKVHSDASYLSESRARSRAAGHFYMGNADDPTDTRNGSILAFTQIMKAVMSSASEAEIGALFENCKRATILRTTLEEMGHPQPATPVQTDIIPPLVVLSTRISSSSAHALLICASIGYEIVQNKGSSTLRGGQDLATWPTTPASITHPPTIRPCGHFTCIQGTVLIRSATPCLQVCEGVSNPHQC
jgi:hypothetical protein